MKIFLQNKWISSSTRNQYLATFAGELHLIKIVVVEVQPLKNFLIFILIQILFPVNILSITHGCALGWTSPIIPYLKSEATHLKSGPIDATEASWIGKS